ncbi:MAG: hypothetical protein LKJ47_00715 [Bifidobacteriaceae bacterium]|jgi:hypothetical protein|nr:hypothetical protein [Bifidobacteriaceae bacterium]
MTESRHENADDEAPTEALKQPSANSERNSSSAYQKQEPASGSASRVPRTTSSSRIPVYHRVPETDPPAPDQASNESNVSGASEEDFDDDNLPDAIPPTQPLIQKNFPALHGHGPAGAGNGKGRAGEPGANFAPQADDTGSSIPYFVGDYTSELEKRSIFHVGGRGAFRLPDVAIPLQRPDGGARPPHDGRGLWLCVPREAIHVLHA